MGKCAGCLKEVKTDFCSSCRQRLFEGVRVSSVLGFTRPEYNQMRLTIPTGRLSISGIQTKMSLALREGRLEMTETGGQYILKPIPRGEFQHLNMLPHNEHVTMQIARQVFGLRVAESARVTFADGEVAYLVRRYDVSGAGVKLLQEDFAQIANRSAESHGSNYKYDFSYEEIGRLIKMHVPAYRIEMEQFFRLVAFNYLIHNGDSHLKNFSLLRTEPSGEYILAPGYDLLNSRLHLPNETRTALDFFAGDFETPSFSANAYYAYDDFRELATRLELRPTRWQRLLEEFIASEKKVLALVVRSDLSPTCQDLYAQHVRDSVRMLGYSFGKYRSH